MFILLKCVSYRRMPFQLFEGLIGTAYWQDTKITKKDNLYSHFFFNLQEKRVGSWGLAAFVTLSDISTTNSSSDPFHTSDSCGMGLQIWYT